MPQGLTILPPKAQCTWAPPHLPYPRPGSGPALPCRRPTPPRAPQPRPGTDRGTTCPWLPIASEASPMPALFCPPPSPRGQPAKTQGPSQVGVSCWRLQALLKELSGPGPSHPWHRCRVGSDTPSTGGDPGARRGRPERGGLTPEVSPLVEEGYWQGDRTPQDPARDCPQVTGAPDLCLGWVVASWAQSQFSQSWGVRRGEEEGAHSCTGLGYSGERRHP